MRQTDGTIYIGDANGNGTEHVITGDMSLSDTGVASVTGVQASKLASAQVSYLKTDAGTKDLLAAAAVDRIVVIGVTVTTVFANGDGTQPTLTLDEEGSAAKFAVAANFTSAAASLKAIVFCGKLSASKKLQATLVAGTGTTETGAYTINVIAVG